MKRIAAALLTAALCTGAGAQTCIPLTRTDVYGLPKEAIDKAYCSVDRETKVSMQRTSDAISQSGLGSAAERSAWRIQSQCTEALLATLTLFRERFGKDTALPDCSATSAPTAQK